MGSWKVPPCVICINLFLILNINQDGKVVEWRIMCRRINISLEISKDQQTNCVLISSTGGQLTLLRVEKIFFAILIFSNAFEEWKAMRRTSKWNRDGRLAQNSWIFWPCGCPYNKNASYKNEIYGDFLCPSYQIWNFWWFLEILEKSLF